MWPICKIKILGKEMCFGKVKRKWKFYNILDFKFVDNFYYYYSLIGFFLPFNLKKNKNKITFTSSHKSGSLLWRNKRE